MQHKGTKTLEPLKSFLNLAVELIIDGQPPEVAALILDAEYDMILQKGKLTPGMCRRIIPVDKIHIAFPVYLRLMIPVPRICIREPVL